MCAFHHGLKTHHGYKLERVGGRWILVAPKDLGEKPVQPELSTGGIPIVRQKRIRQIRGTAPPKKIKKKRSERPAPWEKDPFQALFAGHEGLEATS